MCKTEVRRWLPRLPASWISLRSSLFFDCAMGALAEGKFSIHSPKLLYARRLWALRAGSVCTIQSSPGTRASWYNYSRFWRCSVARRCSIWVPPGFFVVTNWKRSTASPLAGDPRLTPGTRSRNGNIGHHFVFPDLRKSREGTVVQHRLGLPPG